MMNFNNKTTNSSSSRCLPVLWVVAALSVTSWLLQWVSAMSCNFLTVATVSITTSYSATENPATTYSDYETYHVGIFCSSEVIPNTLLWKLCRVFAILTILWTAVTASISVVCLFGAKISIPLEATRVWWSIGMISALSALCSAPLFWLDPCYNSGLHYTSCTFKPGVGFVQWIIQGIFQILIAAMTILFQPPSLWVEDLPNPETGRHIGQQEVVTSLSLLEDEALDYPSTTHGSSSNDDIIRIQILKDAHRNNNNKMEEEILELSSFSTVGSELTSDENSCYTSITTAPWGLLLPPLTPDRQSSNFFYRDDEEESECGSRSNDEDNHALLLDPRQLKCNASGPKRKGSLKDDIAVYEPPPSFGLDQPNDRDPQLQEKACSEENEQTNKMPLEHFNKELFNDREEIVSFSEDATTYSAIFSSSFSQRYWDKMDDRIFDEIWFDDTTSFTSTNNSNSRMSNAIKQDDVGKQDNRSKHTLESGDVFDDLSKNTRESGDVFDNLTDASKADEIKSAGDVSIVQKDCDEKVIDPPKSFLHQISILSNINNGEASMHTTTSSSAGEAQCHVSTNTTTLSIDDNIVDLPQEKVTESEKIAKPLVTRKDLEACDSNNHKKCVARAPVVFKEELPVESVVKVDAEHAQRNDNRYSVQTVRKDAPRLSLGKRQGSLHSAKSNNPVPTPIMSNSTTGSIKNNSPSHEVYASFPVAITNTPEKDRKSLGNVIDNRSSPSIVRLSLGSRRDQARSDFEEPQSSASIVLTPPKYSHALLSSSTAKDSFPPSNNDQVHHAKYNKQKYNDDCNSNHHSSLAIALQSKPKLSMPTISVDDKPEYKNHISCEKSPLGLGSRRDQSRSDFEEPQSSASIVLTPPKYSHRKLSSPIAKDSFPPSNSDQVHRDKYNKQKYNDDGNSNHHSSLAIALQSKPKLSMPTISVDDKPEYNNHISCEKSPLGEIFSSSVSYEVVTNLAEQESPLPSNENMPLDEVTAPSSPVNVAKHNHVPSSKAALSEKISDEPKHDYLNRANGLNNQSEPPSSPVIKTVYALLGELKEHVNNTKLSLQASPIRSPLCAAHVQLKQSERPVLVENLEPAKKEIIHLNSSICNEGINDSSSDVMNNNDKESRQVASVEHLVPTGTTTYNQLPKFTVPPITTQQLPLVNKSIGAAMITPENKIYNIRSCTPPRYPRPAVDHRTKNANRVPVTPEAINLQSDEMEV